MKDLNTIRQWEREGTRGGFARLDTRALLIVFLAFVGFVVAASKYQWKQLLAYFAFPIFFIVAANLPLKPLFKKLLFVSPFIIFLGVFNPFFDKAPVFEFFGWVVTGGMISFIVILLKGTLSVLAIAILTSLIPFHEVCGAMAALRIPQALVMQILFLYRYLFVLVEEAQSMQKARDMRAFDGKGKGIADTSKLLGTLFLRTLDRSQRIYRAMVSRGFAGRIPVRTNSRFGLKEAAFIILSIGLLTGLSIYPF